jgi:hypothetical protein
MRRILMFVLALASPILAVPAHAQVCATLDTSKDNLPENERQGAMTFLTQALASNGLQVVPGGCTGTYSVYHVRFGTSVTVYLNGPQGSRQATARTLEDVPPLYSQMVRSLLTGQPMNGSNSTVDRTNVTTAQMAPNRVEADSLWYARLGYGLMAAGGVGGGPAFGFGYRYELDSIGVDFSFLNLTVPSDTSNGDKVTGSFLRLMGLYFADPVANGSLYVGGGLSWAGGGFGDSGGAYLGSGLQGEVVTGYELLRASTIRLFVQIDASLPFFAYKRALTLSSMSNTDSKWGPAFVAAMGIGWGRSRTLTVRTIH